VSGRSHRFQLCERSRDLLEWWLRLRCQAPPLSGLSAPVNRPIDGTRLIAHDLDEFRMHNASFARTHCHVGSESMTTLERSRLRSPSRLDAMPCASPPSCSRKATLEREQTHRGSRWSPMVACTSHASTLYVLPRSDGSWYTEGVRHRGRATSYVAAARNARPLIDHAAVSRSRSRGASAWQAANGQPLWCRRPHPTQCRSVMDVLSPVEESRPVRSARFLPHGAHSPPRDR